MNPLLRSFHDPLYVASAAALLVIAIVSGALASTGGSGDAADTPLPVATTSVTPAGTATPSPAETAADTRRLADLAAISEAIEAYRTANGEIPTTEDDFGTICQQAFDSGCLLLSVDSALPTDDGEHAYWWQSDGASYTLFAHVAAPPEPGGCPTAVPPALRPGHVACVNGGQ